MAAGWVFQDGSAVCVVNKHNGIFKVSTNVSQGEYMQLLDVEFR
jgi:hypothetical protein